MSSRQEIRIEKKKRKAAAFLRLVADTEESKKDDESPTCKKAKSDDGVEGNDAEGSNKTNKKQSISDEMYAEYKHVIAERRKAAMQKPKVFLTVDELTRDYAHHVDENGVNQAPPLYMSDVQHLLLFAILNVHSSFKPRWCRLLRVCKVTKVVAVVLDSLSATEYNDYKPSLPTLNQAFDLNVDMIAPVQYGSSVREDIMNVPVRREQYTDDNVPESQEKNAKNKRVPKVTTAAVISTEQKWQKGRLIYQTVRTLLADPTKIVEGVEEESVSPSKTNNTDHVEENDLSLVCDDGTEEAEYVSTYEQDQFDRRWLMLNNAQIHMEAIPLPDNLKNSSFEGFLYSKHKYTEVTSKSPMFAVDCEMVQTTASGMDLARISIVDENLQVVYDSFVKPKAKVTDYVTKYSGITKELLDPVTTTIKDIQKVIRRSLPSDAILCGQSIGSDLRSMKLFHPYLIDTSVIYNLTGTRMKTGLRKLTAIFLSRNIQDSSLGHSSVEDAQATMELVLLKLRNKINFGDVKMRTETLPDIDLDSVDANENNYEEEEDQMDMSGLLTRTKLPDHISPELERKRLFFQQRANKFLENFLNETSKREKYGVVIDEEDSKEVYPSNQFITSCSSDKDSQRQILACQHDTDFCFTHLYAYRNLLRDNKDSEEIDDEEKKKCLWKMDRRIWKIMMGLPASSLFVVILTGRNDNGVIQSAKTFAKIL